MFLWCDHSEFMNLLNDGLIVVYKSFSLDTACVSVIRRVMGHPMGTRTRAGGGCGEFLDRDGWWGR
jgi:hypothetical protein